MANMEFIHGLEKALEIVNKRKNENEKCMKHYAEVYSDYAKKHPADVFYAKLMADYIRMYTDARELYDELEVVGIAIEKEIDKELNVDAEAV